MHIGISFGTRSGLYRFGIYVGFSNQASGAPFMDKSTTIVRHHVTNAEITRFQGVCFLMTPWRRNQYGEALPQRALVVALEHAS